MKQKKKNSKVNNKFNFDDDFIIGISSSDEKDKKNKKTKTKKKSKSKTKKNVTKKGNTKTKKKVSNPKREKRIRVFRIVFVLIVICGFIAFLMMSPIFNLKNIEVEDNDFITEEEIIELSGIKENDNIFRLSKSKIAKKIEKNPYIDSVEIKRVIPSTIEISVVERTPAFMTDYSDGRYIYINSNGYVLEFSNERLELPILDGLSTDFDSMVDLEGNKNRLNEDDLEKLNTVLKIMNVAENNDLSGLITRINVSNSKDYLLILESEDKIVHVGNGTDLNTRLLWAKQIIDSERGIKGEILVNGNLNNEPPFFRESI